MQKDLNWHVSFVVFVAAFGSGFQYGYNNGVVNVPQKILENFINTTQAARNGGSGFSKEHIAAIWGFTVAVYCLGGMIGASFTAFVAERLGRKRGLLANNLSAIVAAILVELARPFRSYEILIVGRFVIGLNAGLNCGLAPLYLVEIAPKTIRGSMGTTFQLVITIAILFSQVVGQPQLLGTDEYWPTLFALPIVPAVMQMFLLLFCPRSPRFLFWKTRDKEKTHQVLKWLRMREDVQAEVDEIVAEVVAAEALAKATLVQVLRDSMLRHMLVLAMIIMMSQQLSGINAVIYYSTSIFENAGLHKSNALLATMAMGTVNVLVTIGSLWLVEIMGRRKLYLSNVFGLIIITLLLAVFLELHRVSESSTTVFPTISVALVFIYIVIFASGLGPIPMFVVNELFDQSTRSTASSVALLVNWTCNFCVSMAFLPLEQLIHGYVFLVFCAFLVVSFIYTFFKMPETKKRSPEEVKQIIEYGVRRPFPPPQFI